MGKNAKGRFQNEIKNKFLLLFRKLKIKQSEREKIRFFIFFSFLFIKFQAKSYAMFDGVDYFFRDCF